MPFLRAVYEKVWGLRSQADGTKSGWLEVRVDTKPITTWPVVVAGPTIDGFLGTDFDGVDHAAFIQYLLGGREMKVRMRGDPTDIRRADIAGVDTALAMFKEECATRQMTVYPRHDPF